MSYPRPLGFADTRGHELFNLAVRTQDAEGGVAGIYLAARDLDQLLEDDLEGKLRGERYPGVD
jgi:hypothetical protein